MTVRGNLALVRSAGLRIPLRLLFSYLLRDPERNLQRMLRWAEAVSVVDSHRAKVRLLRQLLAKYPSAREIARRLYALNPKMQRGFLFNWLVTGEILGIPVQRYMSRRLGIPVPNLIILDPTSACNLKCKGCWASDYRAEHLDIRVIHRVLDEAKGLGIYFVTMTGGEPMLYPRLMEIFENHRDVAFMVYTNGTRVDEKTVDYLMELGNVSLCLSIEGWQEQTDARRGPGVWDQVMRVMDMLRERRAMFGFSVTINSQNAELVYSDEFIDFMIGKGALYGWTFHYIPVGHEPDLELMVRPEQRAHLVERLAEIRRTKPILMVDFWNDGELTKGCIAGGREYMHICASGDVEPCNFVHFSVDNIKEKSLREVLGSPLFRAYNKRQPVCDNHLRPCPIIDVPSVLRDIINEVKPRPTCRGAEAILSGHIAEFLDERAAQWKEISDRIWAKRQAASGHAEGDIIKSA